MVFVGLEHVNLSSRLIGIHFAATFVWTRERVQRAFASGILTEKSKNGFNFEFVILLYFKYTLEQNRFLLYQKNMYIMSRLSELKICVKYLMITYSK